MKHAARRAFGVLFVALVAGANGGGCDVVSKLSAPYRYGVAQLIRTRDRASTLPTREGPVRLRGRLRGPEARVTPAGTRAAASVYWVSAVTDVRPRGSRNTQCLVRQLDETSVELDAGTSVPLVGWNVASPTAMEPLREPMNEQMAQAFRQLAALLLPQTQREIAPPATVDANCINPRASSHAYSEVVALEGSVIEVSGCFRRGQLEPCGDGGDAWCGSGDCEEFVRANLRAAR